jgi:hypothetical protein
VVEQVRGRGTQLAFAGLQWLSSQQGTAQREITQAAAIASADTASAPATTKDGPKTS